MQRWPLMRAEIMRELFTGIGLVTLYVGPLMLILCAGGVFSDYILPRCPRLLRLLERVLTVKLR